MRIACVITDLQPGGAEKFMVELLLRIDRRQFTPAVFVLQPPPSPDRAELPALLARADVPVQYLAATSAWQAPLVTLQLSRLLTQFRPDVVQTFLYHANVTGILAARMAGVRNVLAGIRVADPTASRRCIERRVYPLARELVCVSEGVRASYACSLPRLRMRVIPNAIDVSLYDDVPPADLASMGIPGDLPLLLFVGRLHRQKGLDWFLDCLPEALRGRPHHVCLAGTGPEEQSLRRRVQTLHMPTRVHFPGYRNDIPSLLARADLLVLPSRYEGMPNVVLQAMAAGRGVVATRVEGLPELLGPCYEQLSVPFGDTAALVEKLTRLLDQREAREQLAARLKERVADHFNWSRVVSSYEAAWRG